MHTGGEPLRVIYDPGFAIQGNNILEKRRFLMEEGDFLRQILIYEPRGHRDMYGAIIVEPSSPENDFGVIFIHNEGYSTMCGHAIIALTKLAACCSWKKPVNNQIQLRIEVPCGVVKSWINLNEDDEFSVGFIGVPSFVVQNRREFSIEGTDPFHAEIAYGGAYYVYLEAESLKLKLEPSNLSELIRTAQNIKGGVSKMLKIRHPAEDDLSFLYGVIFRNNDTQASRSLTNVCIFADGEVDRSPTGSGVCGYLACLNQRGELVPRESIIVESLTKSRFRGTILQETVFHGFPAIIPQVQGNAYITGVNEWLLDRQDPLKTGFLLR